MSSPEEIDRELADGLRKIGQSDTWQKMLAWSREQRELGKERREKRKGKRDRSSAEIAKAELKRNAVSPEKLRPEAVETTRAPKEWPEHVIAENGVVITYRFDESTPSGHPQRGYVLRGFLGSLFGSDHKVDIYAEVDQKLREIMKATPNADFRRFENTFGIKIVDVQRANQGLGGGIYV